MHKIVLLAFLVKTAHSVPFPVINAVFLAISVFLRYTERLIFTKNALILLRYGSRSYNFKVLKMAKNGFLVRYGSRQIAFLTLIPFGWCGIC
jgi:hypothetical protein